MLLATAWPLDSLVDEQTGLPFWWVKPALGVPSGRKKLSVAGVASNVRGR